MIAYVHGNLVQKEATFLIIDVGGIGYHIKVSLNTSSAIGDQPTCKIYTHLHIREDAHTLYGFYDLLEKKMFLDLIGVSGVGANTALIILSSLSTQEITQAILREDVKTIQSVKGIGLKTAQRIILDLKDKVGKDDPVLWENLHAGKEKRTSSLKAQEEAVLALIALGINKQTAEKNIDAVIKQKGQDLPVEELIKLALKI
ncbi:MAG: Holliday junction branch migration protein RuvA [Microscillaceae bacterium]|nr:Holliday junction branch migration protein RuvA [Microscillaceae bacterium]